MTKKTEYKRDAVRPHALIDHIRQAHKLPNDAAIARRAGLAAPTLSKIRNGADVTDTVLVRIHEAFGMAFPDMRALIARNNAAADQVAA